MSTLEFTETEEAFRLEARAWLAANNPGRLPSMDTAEGAAAHREWEREHQQAESTLHRPWMAEPGLSAHARAACSPRVRLAKIGAQPGGSMTTKKVTNEVMNNSITVRQQSRS